jgi:PAS domain S-box-containing protein
MSSRLPSQLRALLAHAHDGVFVTAPSGHIVFWNGAAEDLLEYRASEAKHRPYSDVLGINGSNGSSGRCCPRIVSGGTAEHFDLHARTKTGRFVWLEITAFAVEEDAMPLAIYVFRDVTRSKELLRRIHEQLAPRLGRAPWLTDREVEVLRAMAVGLGTRAAAERLRVSPATIRNHTQNIFGKLGVHTRLMAVLYATRCGLL